MCRRCGEKATDFGIRLKGLEGKLLQRRLQALQCLAAEQDSENTLEHLSRLPGASKVPTEKRILRGLVTLNAGWMSAVASSATNAAATTPSPSDNAYLGASVFTRSDLTGICSALHDYDRSRRMVDSLASADAIRKLSPLGRTKSSAQQAEKYPQVTNETGVSRLDRETLYTIGEQACTEISGLLLSCRALGVDAGYYLDIHLTHVLDYLRYRAPRSQSGEVLA